MWHISYQFPLRQCGVSCKVKEWRVQCLIIKHSNQSTWLLWCQTHISNALSGARICKLFSMDWPCCTCVGCCERYLLSTQYNNTFCILLINRYISPTIVRIPAKWDVIIKHSSGWWVLLSQTGHDQKYSWSVLNRLTVCFSKIKHYLERRWWSLASFWQTCSKVYKGWLEDKFLFVM